MGIAGTRVGSFDLGATRVLLYLRRGRGGEYYLRREECPYLVIGRDGTWTEISIWLLHEAFEYAMESNKCKYRKTSDFSGASDSVSFMFTHAQFSVMADEVAEFIATVTPAIRKLLKGKKI